MPRYEFREDGFYVDGRKTFLKGVCYHQDRAGKGWAISADDAVQDIAAIQKTHAVMSGTFGFASCSERP